MDFGRLVPRLTTPSFCVMRGMEGLVLAKPHAVVRIRVLRCPHTRKRRCGMEGAGFELFSGVNVPSKAFGKFVESGMALRMFGTGVESASSVGKGPGDFGQSTVARVSKHEYTRRGLLSWGRVVYRVHDLRQILIPW
ncbi:MAG: hypothetical protein CM1200mP41_04980 [Gammaproteobacteria bacterium]|nr:MAG: hypothetical protein CM1200mP41_04980 [Gammaproteobacteria bacterium]